MRSRSGSRDELRTRILEPLALGDTSLAEGGEMPEGIVHGYQLIGGELVSPASFKEMFTFVPEPERPGIAQGLGVYRIGSTNGELVGNDGQGVGFGSSLMWLKEADISVVVLVNMAPDEGKINGVRDGAIAWVLAQPLATTNKSSTPAA